MDSARKSSVLQGAAVLVPAVCHTKSGYLLHPDQLQVLHNRSTQSHLHTSTCSERSLGTAWKHIVLSLTYDREDQQDAADNDGDNDCRFSSPKVQHGNCVVELSNLDLRKEKEGGKAGAEQHVAKGLGAGRDTGPH